MILAAGYGKRLRPLTDKMPKPMVPVNGKPLLQYHLEHLAAADIRELVINTSWLGGQIEEYFGDGSHYGVTIEWSREAEPLETGGGIYQALPLLGSEPFVLLNGDIWSDYSFSRLSGFVLGDDCDAHLVLVPNPEHHVEGDYAIGMSERVESLGGAGLSYTFSGISVIAPAMIKAYRSSSRAFPLRDVLQQSINKGRVTAEVFHGYWCDVGTPGRLHELRQRVS